MVQNKELEKLRKEIELEKKKIRRQQLLVKTAAEKKQLQRELLLLRNPKKLELARRLGRGSKIVGTKVFKLAVKQGRLIQEQQERDRKLAAARQRQPILKPKKRKKARGPTRVESGFGLFGELNF